MVNELEMIEKYKNLMNTNIKRFRQEYSDGDRRDISIDKSYNFDRYSHSDFIERSEFSRDKDRILFSRAFRRLEHKAQIFSHERGDHYRTRLTHTLEVAQIARNISQYLGLNEDLAEAITLGHDIGHTPFGHEGERVLDLVLGGKDDLSRKIRYKINYGGFKHNFNSVRVLDIIEKKYNTEKGLNLTWQVLEGILKHTKTRRNDELCWDINRFIQNIDKNYDRKFKEFLYYENSVTLEGQIVSISDEIAQRQHDLDDGMRDRYLNLNYEKVANEIRKIISEILISYKNKNDVYLSLLIDLDTIIEKRSEEANQSIYEDEYKRDTLIRDIIEYFICDVTLTSFYNIDKNAEKSMIVDGPRKFFSRKIIDFSEIGAKFDKKINQYINNRIVNSNQVNRFDGKANYVINRLFKAYYFNPLQMSEFSLKRLRSLILENSDIYSIRLKNYTDENENPIAIKNISFSESKPDEVKKLIEYLKLEININELIHPLSEHLNVNPKNLNRINDEDSDYLTIGELPLYKLLKSKELKLICQRSIILQKNEIIDKQNDEERFIKCMLEDHYAFLSVICDYISGMTDNYANNEYSQLYQT